MKICSKCGKVMTALPPSELTLCAIEVKLDWGLASHQGAELTRASLGKYAPPEGETSVEFNFCYECYLDALMGVAVA